MKPIYVYRNKYRITEKILEGCSGTLLDIGARDRSLLKFLDSTRIQYFSADLGPGHDYQLDLENKLQFDDQSFAHVVALDVLEHLETIHQAFHELARITGQTLIIALPTFSSLPRRFWFLFRGGFQTGKYDLLPDHQGDRHRWLTLYPQINRFITTNAERAGFQLDAQYEEIDLGLPGKVAGAFAAPLLPRGLLTSRCIYKLVRQG